MPSFGFRIAALRQEDKGARRWTSRSRPSSCRPGAPRERSRSSRTRARSSSSSSAVSSGTSSSAARWARSPARASSVGEEITGSEAVYGAVVALKGAIRPELSFRGAVPIGGGRPGYSELLAGLRATFGPAELFALGGPGFFNAVGTPEWRGVVGLAFGRMGAKEEAAPASPPRRSPRPRRRRWIRARPARPTRPSSAPRSMTTATASRTATTPARRRRASRRRRVARRRTRTTTAWPTTSTSAPAEAGAADNAGCPRVVVEKETKKIELREQVLFDLGKTTIRPESGTLLDEIATVLKQHPEITRVLVEGHTDSTGSARVNKRLSQARAEAVVNALVERGVEKARLAAKGFGSSRPIASNDTPEGRDANRRVEISIVQAK